MEALTKAELRAILKERRASIEKEDKRELDRAIVEIITSSEMFLDASILLLYVPIGSEINLLHLVRTAWKMGKPVAFPRTDPESCTMQFYYLNEGARLTEGAYGIPEPPADAPLCIPDERALCVLPALSFDLSGNRLGYGKGYYDRYLSAFPGVTLGAVYSHLVLKEVPTDEHDIPAQFLATEKGMCQALPKPKKVETDEPKEPAAAPIEPEQATEEEPPTAVVEERDGWRRALSALLSFLNREDRDGVKPRHAPAALVTVTFLLLLLSRLCDTHLLNRSNEYVGVILLQLLIFVIPAALYCKLRGMQFTERIRMRLPRPNHVLFLLFTLIVMIASGLLCSILTGGISSLVGNFTLYGTFMAHTGTPLDILYSVMAYALLPAFGEELIYRSILSAEYESAGTGVAVIIGSLFFAMLHFSLPLFPAYFVLGAILALSMYVTRSFFAPFFLHLCYNLFCLFGQPYLSAFYVHAGSSEIFIFCLCVLLLLFAAFATGEARKIYHLYAIRNEDSTYTVSVPLSRYPARLLRSLLSPASAVAILIFLFETL